MSYIHQNPKNQTDYTESSRAKYMKDKSYECAKEIDLD